MAKKQKKTDAPAPATSQGTTRVKITSPLSGAALSSPLVVLCARYEGATSRTAVVRVGTVVQYVELKGSTGQLRENVTLLEGRNTISVEIDGERDVVEITLPQSSGIRLGGETQSETPRVLDLSGSYEDTSCPAGVIACNGFMQQFAVLQASGSLAEKVVLAPGDNHVAVQIGEKYATKLVKGTFPPAHIVTTLVWDTSGTDVDLYVIEPDGAAVYYATKRSPQGGNLDVDRRSGFGPENYSLRTPKPGRYRIRVHFYSGGGGFAAGGVARTEWTARVLLDEATPGQRRRSFYGFLEVSNAGNANASSDGPDWNEICEIDVGRDGRATIVGGA